MTNVLQQQLLYFFTWSSNQLLNLNIFLQIFYLSTQFFSVLTLESSAIHWLANLFPSFWLFLVLYWMLRMLVTMFKLCHVPHASRITTWGTLSTEIYFGVSKEWVRSWSHASLIIYHKTFVKKLKAARPKSYQEGEKEKEKERKLENVMR